MPAVPRPGGGLNLHSPGPIGDVTPGTGAFTGLTRTIYLDFTTGSGNLDGSTPSYSGTEVEGAGVWEMSLSGSISKSANGADAVSGFAYDGRIHYLTGIETSDVIPDVMEIAYKRTSSSGVTGVIGPIVIWPGTGRSWTIGMRDEFGPLSNLGFEYHQLDSTGGGGSGPIAVPGGVSTIHSGDVFRLRVTRLSSSTLALEMAQGSATDGSGYIAVAGSPFDAGSVAFPGSDGLQRFRVGINAGTYGPGLATLWARFTGRFGIADRAERTFVYIGDSNGVLSAYTGGGGRRMPTKVAGLISSARGEIWECSNCAMSSTSSDDWANGTSGALIAPAMVKAARGDLSCVVISLGTNDAKSGGGQISGASYATNLRAIIAAIRATSGFSTLPIILCKPAYVAASGSWDSTSQTRITDYGSGVATIAGDTSGVTAVDLYTPSSGGAWLPSGEPVHYCLSATGSAAAAYLIANAIGSTQVVADGTYTLGLGVTTNGTITFASGIPTAIQQAS